MMRFYTVYSNFGKVGQCENVCCDTRKNYEQRCEEENCGFYQIYMNNRVCKQGDSYGGVECRCSSSGDLCSWSGSSSCACNSI